MSEELKKLEELLANDRKIIEENYKEIERLTKILEEAQLGYLAVEEKNKRLHSIIKEVREEIRILETNCDIVDYQAQKLFQILDKESKL